MTDQITHDNYHFNQPPATIHSRPSTTALSTVSTALQPKSPSYIHAGGHPIKLNDTITAGKSPVDQASDFMRDYQANYQNRYKSRSNLKGEGLVYVPPLPPPIPGQCKTPTMARSEGRPAKSDIHQIYAQIPKVDKSSFYFPNSGA